MRTVERFGGIAALKRYGPIARATVRFETRPGQQLQIDFGQTLAEIEVDRRPASFPVATLAARAGCDAPALLGVRQEPWIVAMRE